MTWPEAVDYACPPSWGAGDLQPMIDAARDALERARDLHAWAIESGAFGKDSSRMGTALACMGAGLDALARSLDRGKTGGRDLLVGDGLITRAMEIATGMGTSGLSLVAELAGDAMGSDHPSAVMLEAARWRRSSSRG